MGVLMGLQMLGTDFFEQLDSCLGKLEQLYGTNNGLPYIKLLSQKMDLFVNMRLNNFQGIQEFSHMTIDLEAQAVQTIEKITAIVGNAPCERFISPLLILTAAAAYKGQSIEA